MGSIKHESAITFLGQAIETDADQGLYAFSTVSWVFEDEVAPIDYDYRLGLYYKGLISGRDDDTTGFIYAHPNVGDVAVQGNLPLRTRTESFWEFTYQAQITDSWGLQGSLQVIENPGGASASTLSDATVLGLRSSFSF